MIIGCRNGQSTIADAEPSDQVQAAELIVNGPSTMTSTILGLGNK